MYQSSLLPLPEMGGPNTSRRILQRHIANGAVGGRVKEDDSTVAALIAHRGRLPSTVSAAGEASPTARPNDGRLVARLRRRERCSQICLPTLCWANGRSDDFGSLLILEATTWTTS